MAHAALGKANGDMRILISNVSSSAAQVVSREGKEPVLAGIRSLLLSFLRKSVFVLSPTFVSLIEKGDADRKGNI